MKKGAYENDGRNNMFKNLTYINQDEKGQIYSVDVPLKEWDMNSNEINEVEDSEDSEDK